MIVYTVSQLLEMSDGTVPEAFRGKIKKVMGPNKGKNKQGKDYSLQKIIITDGSKEIEVMLDGRDDISRTMEGSQIFVAASRGERALSGLKRKDNVWKEKTTPQVWIYDNAELSFENAAGGAVTPPPQQHTQTPSASNGPGTNGNHTPPAAKTETQPPAATGGIANKRSLRQQSMKDFDKRIGRTAAALNRCFDAAYKLIADVNTRHGKTLVIQPTGELVEKIAMGLMVNACWSQKPAEQENFPMKAFQLVEEEDAKFDQTSQKPADAPPQRDGVPFN
jgi:hypothetical protein